MEWNGMEWNGKKWKGTEQNGLKRIEMGWNGASNQEINGN